MYDNLMIECSCYHEGKWFSKQSVILSKNAVCKSNCQNFLCPFQKENSKI
jgi:hypothetical protein